MKAKKTTLLSILICVAGILTEIIFRDVLSRSIAGVWMSILLAVVILVLVYFIYDGIYSYFEAKQELDAAYRMKREQKLYHILNEQLQFEKAIFQEVTALKQANEKLSERIAQTRSEGRQPVSVAAPDAEQLDKAVSAVNEHTMKAAKIIAKYVNQNALEMKELLEDKHTEQMQLLKDMEGSQRTLFALEEQKKLH